MSSRKGCRRFIPLTSRGVFSPQGYKLVRICQEALDRGITLVKDGIRVGTLSAAIQDVIESAGAGFVPLKNLTGHRIGRYDLHAGMTIPNVKSFCLRAKLKTGMIDHSDRTVCNYG